MANPSRPPRIQSILYKNKEKIAKLLTELAPYRAEDKQFTEARHFVEDEIVLIYIYVYNYIMFIMIAYNNHIQCNIIKLV